MSGNRTRLEAKVFWEQVQERNCAKPESRRIPEGAKLEVTINQLKRVGACTSGRLKVLKANPGISKNAPISLLSILESNGLDDAIWALRCVKSSDRDNRLFAVWCARQVEHLMKDQRGKQALDVAEKYANGEATQGELLAARAAAAYAYADARSIAVAAADARSAAAADARSAARSTQKEMFIKMCKGEAPWQI